MTALDLFHTIAARVGRSAVPRARVLLLFWPDEEGAALERRLAAEGIQSVGVYTRRQLRLYLAHAFRGPRSIDVDLVLAAWNPEEPLTSADRALLYCAFPETPHLARIPHDAQAMRDTATRQGAHVLEETGGDVDAVVSEALRMLATPQMEAQLAG